MSELNTKLNPIDLSTFHRLYKNDPAAPFYVVNRSTPRSNLLANATNDDNSPVIISIPVTFIPIDLTQYAPLHSLIKSTTIRQALSRGHLRIIRTDEAIAYMQSSERARKAHAELFKSEWRAPLSLEAEEGLDMDGDGEELAANNINDMDVATNKYSDNQLVNDIIMSSRGGETSDAIIASILNQIDMLEADDLNCIAQNVTDSEVKDFCIQQS